MAGKLKPLIAAISTVAFLTACGGGGSSSSPTPSPTPAPPPAPDPTTMLSGSVAKGIVLGGVVSAYYVTDTGEKGDQIGDSSTTSDTDGSYELELPSSYDGSPFMIEITAQDGTMMRCDLAQCSADPLVEFGDDYPLGENFVLRAMSSGVDAESDTINATVITTMATELTLKRVASGASVADATETAKSQVANVFGITGDVNDVPVVDITDPNAVNDTDADTLEANLVNAAVAQSSLASGASLEEAVTATVTKYADDGFADNDGGSDDPTTSTLEEILTEAQNLITKIEEKAEEEGVELDTEVTETKTKVTTQVTLKSESTDTTAKQGEADPNAGSAGLVATKQFTAQVRNLNAATEMEGALDVFDMDVSMAEQLATPNAEALFLAIDSTLIAVAEAYEQVNYYDYAESTYIDTYGTAVEISTDGDATVYTVTAPADADINGIPFTGVMVYTDNGTTIEETEVQTSTGYDYQFTAAVDLSVRGEGTATSMGYSTSLTIGEGSHVVLAIDEGNVLEQTETTYIDTYQGVISVVDVSLEVVLEQPAVTDLLENPVTFTGNIDFDVSDYEYSDTYQNVPANDGTREESSTEIQSFGAIMLTLAGELTNGITSLDAVISIALENVNNTCTWTSGDGVWVNECVLTDDPDDYPTGSLTIGFDVVVEGLTENNTASVMATLSRELYETAGLNLEVSYGGLMMDVEATGYRDEAEATTLMLTMTNQAGVTMTLSGMEDEMGDMMFESGTIVVDGVKYADISEKDDGTMLITYTDGTFESF